MRRYRNLLIDVDETVVPGPTRPDACGGFQEQSRGPVAGEERRVFECGVHDGRARDGAFQRVGLTRCHD